MASVQLFNLARMTVTAGGTGTLTLGTNAPGYLTFANAGVPNGVTVRYGIIDGANSEIGSAVYTASGTTLSSRSVLKSTNSNTPINVTTSAQVFICPAAEDFRQIYLDDGSVGAPSLTFLNNDSTGLYRIGANNLGIAANGAKVLDIGTTGLGVTGQLSVTGDTFIGLGDTGINPARLFLNGGSGAGGGAAIVYQSHGTSWWVEGTHSAIFGSGTNNDYIIYSLSHGIALRLDWATGAIVPGILEAIGSQAGHSLSQIGNSEAVKGFLYIGDQTPKLVATGSNELFAQGCFSGFAEVCNDDTGQVALYYFSTAGFVGLIGGSSEWVASTSTPASGKSSFFSGGSYWAIYNNTGSNCHYRIKLDVMR